MGCSEGDTTNLMLLEDLVELHCLPTSNRLYSEIEAEQKEAIKQLCSGSGDKTLLSRAVEFLFPFLVVKLDGVAADFGKAKATLIVIVQRACLVYAKKMGERCFLIALIA